MRLHSASEPVPDQVPAGCERISLVQVDSTEYCYYQVERSNGDFYLCDADGDKVQLPTTNWTCLRVLADVPADDSDAFFAAIEATAKPTKMSLEDQVRILSTMTNRDHAGRHFTARYSDDVLDQLEEAGYIEINRPVHEPTGIDYSREYWTLQTTDAALDLVREYPEYHDTQD